MQNLVIVAGHAILRDPQRLNEDAGWFLLDFQKGEAPCYIEHVRAGVEAAAATSESLLIFAGGQSRAAAGPRSEALSYFLIAEQLNWFGHPPPAVATEEFSRDSFENFLFSLARCKEVTGGYPHSVTFVSWAFKQDRFELHRQAIRWPAARFRYLGPNNPPALDQALAAEQRTYSAYLADPYSNSPELQAKRAARNPFHRQHGYQVSCRELQPLMNHHGPGTFSGALPWDGASR